MTNNIANMKTSVIKSLIIGLLCASGVAVAATQTTMYTIDGNSIKPLDISTGDGVIANSDIAPTIMESGVSAIISAAKEKKFMYMLNVNTNKVSVYWKESGGILTKKSELDVAAGSHPVAMILSADDAHAYVVNRDSNNISMYNVNQDTGALTALGGPVTTGSGPVAMVLSPDGKRAFVANKTSSDLSSYTVDSATGVLTRISGSTVVGLNPVALRATKNKDGAQFIYALNDGGSSGGSISAFAVPETGGTLIKTQPATFLTNGKHPSAMSLLNRESGSFLYVNNNTDVSKDSLAVFQISDAGTPTLIQSMISSYTSPTHANSTSTVATMSSIDPRSGFLYASNAYNGTVAAYIIESATAKLAAAPVSVSTQSTSNTAVIIMGEDDIDETPESLEITPDTSTVTVHGSGEAWAALTRVVIKNNETYPFYVDSYSIHKYSDGDNDDIPHWEINTSSSYIYNPDFNECKDEDKLSNKGDECHIYVHVNNITDGPSAYFYLKINGYYVYENGDKSSSITYISPSVKATIDMNCDELGNGGAGSEADEEVCENIF